MFSCSALTLHNNIMKTSRCGWCWCSSINAADKKVENGCTGNDSRSSKEDQPRPEITINGLGGGRLGQCFSCFADIQESSCNLYQYAREEL